MLACVGEGSKRGIEMVGLLFEMVVVRVGRPAREAWMSEVVGSRWVPGPGAEVEEGPRGRPGWARGGREGRDISWWEVDGSVKVGRVPAIQAL